MENLLTMAEVAEQLRVSASTVGRWCRRGAGGVRLESYRAGGLRLVAPEFIDRFVQRSTAAGTLDRKPQRDHRHLATIDHRLRESGLAGTE